MRCSAHLPRLCVSALFCPLPQVAPEAAPKPRSEAHAAAHTPLTASAICSRPVPPPAICNASRRHRHPLPPLPSSPPTYLSVGRRLRPQCPQGPSTDWIDGGTRRRCRSRRGRVCSGVGADTEGDRRRDARLQRRAAAGGGRRGLWTTADRATNGGDQATGATRRKAVLWLIPHCPTWTITAHRHASLAGKEEPPCEGLQLRLEALEAAVREHGSLENKEGSPYDLEQTVHLAARATCDSATAEALQRWPRWHEAPGAVATGSSGRRWVAGA